MKGLIFVKIILVDKTHAAMQDFKNCCI